MRSSRRYAFWLLVVVGLAGFSLVGLTVLGARPTLGLDLKGGLSVVLEAQGRVDSDVLDKTVEIIRDRVDRLGAQEPDISRAGDANIIVQLPDIRDPDRALEIIGKTAQLRFREVRDQVHVDPIRSEAEVAARADGLAEGTDAFDVFVSERIEQQTGMELSEEDPLDQEVVYPSEDGSTWFRLGPAEVQGAHVADAFASFSQQPPGGWIVSLQLTSEGAQAFGNVTTRLAPTGATPGGQLAIVLDRLVESAPQVQQPITDGQAQITGQFSEPEARDLALVLKTGALPIELEPIQVQQVSATLGTASLRAGLLAGAIGLTLVAVYMLAFYRLLGLITLVGLGIFGVLVLGVIGLLGETQGFTLTLAGVAGLIVSLGIAADSYIIYYERVKDELKDGKTFRSAVDRGFSSAFRTNLAGNSVAAAAALILWLLAVGPVRGFALTLGLSVVIDIGLLYFYTHPAVVLIARSKRFGGLRLVGMREVVEQPA